MVNINKRYRGCKDNLPIVQKVPGTFTEFVMGFCDDQTDQRTEMCQVCGHPAICTAAHIQHDYVFGKFTCTECESVRDMRVNMHVLKEMYDALRQV